MIEKTTRLSSQCTIGFFLAVTLLAVSDASAQLTAKPKKIDVPAPERVLIETKDNVELQAEWFGGASGKEAVPIMLIHDWDGNRTDLLPLAEFLQKEHGHAVIVPDLRGHGESMTVKGIDEELNRTKFKKPELASMLEDFESCRRFLQQKNDAGELNLDMLVVIACGKMSIHAANWCIMDWRWGPIGGVKQGRNVKALILISPVKRFKSLDISASLKAPLFASKESALPLLLVWGDGHEASSADGEFIYNALQKSRSIPDEFPDQETRWAQQTLFRAFYRSAEADADLLRELSTQIYPDLALFIEKKVIANKEDFLWQIRKTK